jgi:UDP-N-acetylglucosamine/UDP-N-acetyl-alpha-D-glucosaminouronate 4-epimerase
MPNTFLVTGGAGFIGSHLVQRLVAQGERVRVLDDQSTGRWENVAPWGDRIEMMKGSICAPETCEHACRGVEFVLHQAALPSVPRSVRDPARSHAVNATGTLNLLIAARDAGVRRFVMASSSSVYGNSEELPRHEGMTPAPLSPYAVNKLSAEHYAQVFHRIYGLETVALRYFNVFGPRQDPHSEYAAVIPRFILASLRGEPAVIYGDGTQSRDFTYVDNVVEANLCACSAAAAPGQVFNVGSGRRHTLLELAATISEFVGRKLPPILAEPRLGDVMHSLADIRLAEAVLGYRPCVGFREGVERTVAYFAAIAPFVAGP